jgi:hypothetical protein
MSRHVTIAVEGTETPYVAGGSSHLAGPSHHSRRMEHAGRLTVQPADRRATLVVVLVLTLVAAIAACVAAIPVLTQGPDLWRRTLGRRRHELRQVEKLFVGERIDHLEKRWRSEHQFSHDAGRGRTDAYFTSPWCVVQAIHDNSNNAVVAFVVTSRHPRFRPTFVEKGSGMTARLLVTRFIDWGDHPNVAVDWNLRYVTYHEEFSAGSPGDHLLHQLAITPMGAGPLKHPDRSSPAFRENVITTYGRSLEPWDSSESHTLMIGGSPYDLRHVLPQIARGGRGDIRG